MKQIRIAPIYYQMLIEMSRKKRQDVNAFLNDLITDKYNQKR